MAVRKKNTIPNPTGKVKAFWDGKASDLGLSEDAVTHRDRNQRGVEIDMVLQYLPRGQRILDVGCGNGYSTAIFSKHASQIVGIDYSDSMIRRARKNYGTISNIRFKREDVLDLRLQPRSFDVVISQRCFINLASWKAQQKALINIANVLKPGGCFFLQEGTVQGREKLNQARELMGLGRMPPVAFNLDFDEEKLWPFLSRYFDIVDVRRLGVYDFISRVVHPLVVSPEEPKYDAKINQVARSVSKKLRGFDDIAREFSAFLRRLD